MLITTNEYFQNKVIEEYLGQVNEQIVIGANLFRDVFASWRDVFGGESVGYKKELEKMKKAAYQGLQNNAKKLNANGIISCRMDIDEVSGGGKSMFMINVYGTAVKFKNDKKNKLHEGDHLNSEQVEYEIIRKKINHNLKNSSRPFLHEKIDVLIKYKICGLLDHGLDENALSMIEENKIIEYLQILPQKEIENWLFRDIHTISMKFWLLTFKSLEERNWYNSKLILELLKDPDPIRRNRGLRLSNIKKNYYEKNDIERISMITNYINNEFQLIIKKKMSKGTFKNTEMWVCPRCLKEILMSSNDCSCGARNRFGLIESLDELKDLLNIRKEVLQDYFY